MATQNVCKWNKFGYCKHGEMCRESHVKEICENSSCKIMCCLKRHPKQCKFFTSYKRCKFDPCAFRHVEQTDSFEYLKKENDVMLSKINDIDKSIKALEAKESETDNFIEKLIAIEKKLEIFTNVRQDIHTKDETIDKLTKKVTEMENNLKDKDDLIGDLVLRLKIVEDKQNTLEEEVDKVDHVIDITSESENPASVTIVNDSAPSDLKVKVIESSEKSNVEKVFECDICTYKTKSENGLKIHKTKKHTYTCRCCNINFTDEADYSNHTIECYSTYRYYDSPMMSPVRFPPRFPTRFPHESPPRFPPRFPLRFPRSPLY